MTETDVLIVGAGPAGSACATFCARAGLKTLVIERQEFPREKVCGDCLNPNVWPVLEDIGVAETIRKLPGASFREVEIWGPDGVSVRLPIAEEVQEIAMKRSAFDMALADHAMASGADYLFGVTLQRLTVRWVAETSVGPIRARVLVAADGRNSTVARFLGLLPSPAPERIGYQTHIPLREEDAGRIQLRFHTYGYCGVAPVSDTEQNICLVAAPLKMPRLREWGESHFGIPSTQQWRTIAPIKRKAIPAADKGLYLVGDAARVMEPFTGEGIYYALKTGLLAGQHIARGATPEEFIRDQAALYRYRKWVNDLARSAVLNPTAAGVMIRLSKRDPRLLTWLTKKVTASHPG